MNRDGRTQRTNGRELRETLITQNNSDSAAPSRHVIIVDDNFAVADGLRRSLEDHGHCVIGMAASVRSAKALVSRTSCEVAVLDIDLKGETVIEVARLLAKADTPFFFVTGFGESLVLPPDLSDAPRLEKPARIEDVLRMIDTLCAVDQTH